MKLPGFGMTADIEHQALRMVGTVKKLEKAFETEPLIGSRKANRIKSIQASVAIEANTLSLRKVTDVIDGKTLMQAHCNNNLIYFQSFAQA